MALQRVNNFDLIRLLAAVQVLFMHAVYWLKVSIFPIVAEIIDWFPGVPVFFMISGCLVTNSFVRLSSFKEYARNRVLRIFPGLWTCLIVSYLLVAWRGELASTGLLGKTIGWFLMQGSFLQFVDFVARPGVTNGVLWSISTELQFYLLMPLIAVAGSQFNHERHWVTIMLIAAAIFSAVFHDWVLDHQQLLLPRLFPTLYASILTNGHFFVFGLLAFIWRDRLFLFLGGRFVPCLVLYLGLRATLAAAGISANEVHSSVLALLVYPILGLVVFSLAFSNVGLSKTVLRGNDFSYGIYIYHMPLLYLLLYLKMDGVLGLVVLSLAVIISSSISWFFVERPCLRLKLRGAQ